MGTSLMVQWLKLHLPMQGLQVWSPVWELRSHVSWPKHQNIKHKLSLYKFKKDFKNDPHAKKKTKNTLKKKGMSVKNNQPVSLCHTPAKQLWTHLLTSGDSCQWEMHSHCIWKKYLNSDWQIINSISLFGEYAFLVEVVHTSTYILAFSW